MQFRDQLIAAPLKHLTTRRAPAHALTHFRDQLIAAPLKLDDRGSHVRKRDANSAIS